MATSLAEIIGDAMVYIDDIRLQEQLATNPALFYRRTSAYVSAAMPMLTSPPELYEHIAHQYVEATYASSGWISTAESTAAVTEVSTGCIGYDLCSVVIRSDDGLYATAYTETQYDSETGVVTFPVQTASGIEYEIDFYKDGSTADLTLSMKRLFGLAIAIVWNERLYNDWLGITPKIKDSAFKSQTESTYIDKLNDRLVTNRQAFQDELKKYEQDNAYRNVLLPYNRRGLI